MIECTDKLVESRYKLQWTYVLKYYPESCDIKQLFEYQQNVLASSMESIQDKTDNNINATAHDNLIQLQQRNHELGDYSLLALESIKRSTSNQTTYILYNFHHNITSFNVSNELKIVFAFLLLIRCMHVLYSLPNLYTLHNNFNININAIS